MITGLEQKEIQEIRKNDTKAKLEKIYNIPVISSVITEAINLLNKESTKLQTLSEVISRDQAIVTKILSIANSPLYGLQRRVTSIDFAIMVLGHHELSNILTSLSVMETFKNVSDKYLNQKEFWMHSFLTGIIAKRLARRSGNQNMGQAFIAGFLHDLGVMITHRFFHKEFVEIYKLVTEKNYSYQKAEKEILGITHDSIATNLLNKWNFPNRINNAVLFHHNPDLSPEKGLPSLVHVADFTIHEFLFGDFLWDKDIELKEEALSYLRFKNLDELGNFFESNKDELIEYSQSNGEIF